MASNLQLPASARRVLISRNPRAGARSGLPAVERLAELLVRRGFLVETMTDIDELTNKSNELLHSGELRCVVSAGGETNRVCLLPLQLHNFS